MLSLFTVFHLNLAYSSIGEEQRPEVVQCCYRPLLRLAREYNLPFGIEASGYTLEAAAAIDPAWLDELRRLTTQGPCEFIGSGYAQIIGPLVPAEVNAANLRLGHQVYERLLGFRPQIALVNEQAYSAGLVQHYLDADYRAIVMEWDNPARYHPEWDPEWPYLPQITCGQHGEEIPLIWNKSIAFQKFQRYAHAEIGLAEYLKYLSEHLSDKARAFSLYGNDIEIFDFRPGRYRTEASLHEDGEWDRIDRFFETLLSENCFRFIRPSQVLDLLDVPGAGNRLHLESSEQPIPVKKQEKYNITRWAVTGRDDLGINTSCWRIYEALAGNRQSTDDDWRELCYLWSSDFRTHITEARWAAYRKRLLAFENKVMEGRKLVASKHHISSPDPKVALVEPSIERNGDYLTIETERLKARLNCRRGLAVDGLWFKDVSDKPLCGTLPHGYYDNIELGADYYTGHIILEALGQPKVTDLNPVDPSVKETDDRAGIIIEGVISTPLGPVRKRLWVSFSEPVLELGYRFDWDDVPPGSLRLGNVTLNPEAFDRSSLFYRVHNGGWKAEKFPLTGKDLDQGHAVSFLVSARSGIGITEGIVEIGDASHCLSIEVDKAKASLVGLVNYREVASSYFCRLALSATEVDETRRGVNSSAGDKKVCQMRIRITAR